MDTTDRKIINILASNARLSLQKVAEECDISSTAVHQRIKKMEDADIIRGTNLVLNHQALGLGTMAFIGVFLNTADLANPVVEAFKKIPEIVECSFTTGTYALFLKIYCRDNQHLTEVLSDKIQALEGISRTETFIVLKHPIDRQIVLE
jgi:Lrp/AsnC family transcriptional regulator for asnA, asnC and gidA